MYITPYFFSILNSEKYVIFLQVMVSFIDDMRKTDEMLEREEINKCH